MPVEHIHCYAPSNEQVLVFVYHKGQHLTIEDGAMFPSDTLIGQLRLLTE